MNTKEKYSNWVDRVCTWMEQVGPIVKGSSSAMQSAPALSGHCKVLFLGHDAHEPFGFTGVDRQRFFEGNGNFNNAKAMGPIWNRPYQSLKRIGHTEILEPDNFMLMNLFYFGADDIKESAANMRKEVMEKCIEFTGELASEIVKPKVIVCYSERSVFDPLKKRLTDVENIQIADGIAVSFGKWNDIPVIGMKHPSGPNVSNKYLDTVLEYVVKYTE